MTFDDFTDSCVIVAGAKTTQSPPATANDFGSGTNYRTSKSILFHHETLLLDQIPHVFLFHDVYRVTAIQCGLPRQSSFSSAPGQSASL